MYGAIIDHNWSLGVRLSVTHQAIAPAHSHTACRWGCGVCVWFPLEHYVFYIKNMWNTVPTWSVSYSDEREHVGVLPEEKLEIGARLETYIHTKCPTRCNTSILILLQDHCTCFGYFPYPSSWCDQPPHNGPLLNGFYHIVHDLT
jgi:hypothetical protein